MTSLQIKLGAYHHDSTVAPYIVLHDSFGQRALEFHDRKFVTEACEKDWRLEEFHQLLREWSIREGYLFDLGDGRYVKREQSPDRSARIKH